MRQRKLQIPIHFPDFPLGSYLTLWVISLAALRMIYAEFACDWKPYFGCRSVSYERSAVASSSNLFERRCHCIKLAFAYVT